ncbi:MAG: AsmA-like C-terminal region-containing protein [Alphaproteobacteria bacterium]|nr:AsmA-like C-terminal region-containing protein [Alphaproteobacteria bacterium]
MSYRLMRYVTKGISICLLILSTLLIIGLYNLSNNKSVNLNFFIPLIEEKLEKNQTGLDIVINNISLTWKKNTFYPRILFNQIILMNKNEDFSLTLPDLVLDINFFSLLHNKLIIKKVSLVDLNINLKRTAEDKLIIDSFNDRKSLSQKIYFDKILYLIKKLNFINVSTNKELNSNINLELLRGSINFIDQSEQSIFYLDSFNYYVSFDPLTFEGNYDLNLEGKYKGSITGIFAFNKQLQKMHLQNKIDQIPLAFITDNFLSNHKIVSSEINISADLEIDIGLDGQFYSFYTKGIIGQGSITSPLWNNQLFQIDQADFTAFSQNQQKIVLENFDIQSLNTIFNSQGIIELADNLEQINFTGTLNVKDLSVDYLKKYWPANAVRNVHQWIEHNIDTAMIRHYQSEFSITFNSITQNFLLDHFNSSFVINDFVFHYLDYMPPVQDGVVTATLNQNEFNAEFNGVRSENIKINDHARLSIGPFDQKDQTIKIQIATNSSLNKILSLLNHPKLEYANKLGFDPAKVEGTVDADLLVNFLAKKDLDMNDIDFKVEGNLNNINIKNIFNNRDLAEGNFNLILNPNFMKIKGEGLLDSIQTNIDWTENFNKNLDQQRSIKLSGQLTTNDIKNWGLDLKDYVKGPISFNVNLDNNKNTIQAIDGSFIFDQTEINVPTLDWIKSKSDHAILNFKYNNLLPQPNNLQFIFTTSTADISGEMNLPFNQSLVKFNRFKLGITDLKNVTVNFINPSLSILIDQGILDIAPFLKQKNEENNKKPFNIKSTGSLKLYNHDNKILDPATIELSYNGTSWNTINIKGDFNNNDDLKLVYTSDPLRQRHELRFVCDNMGYLLKQLGILENIEDGKMKISGYIDDRDPQRVFYGKSKMGSFRFTNASFLARLFTMASLTGILDLLTGEGVWFTNFSSDFSIHDGKINIPELRAHGPSLGITSRGIIDFAHDKIDLEGTIAPAYLLNSILNNIPIIGPIINGGEGEGIFSSTYKAYGSINQPIFDINHFSILTPGFLRDIFNPESDNLDDDFDDNLEKIPDIQPFSPKQENNILKDTH